MDEPSKTKGGFAVKLVRIINPKTIAYAIVMAGFCTVAAGMIEQRISNGEHFLLAGWIGLFSGIGLLVLFSLVRSRYEVTEDAAHRNDQE